MIIKSKLVENPFLNVDTYSNGQACIVNLQKQPDVVILDFTTKGLHGDTCTSTLKEIQRSRPTTQVIIVCTSKHREMVSNLVCSTVMYLVKGPTFSSQLRRMVDQLLSVEHSKQQVA